MTRPARPDRPFRLRLRAVAMVAIAAVVGSTLATLAVSPASALGAPFPGNVPSVFISQFNAGSGQGTSLYRATLDGGAMVIGSPQVSADYNYNALAYRQSDGYLYAVSPEGLLKIGQDGQAELLGQVTSSDGSVLDGSQVTGTFGTGAFADTYFTTGSTDTVLLATDVDTLTTHAIPLSEAAPGADITAAFGFLWGVAGSGGSVSRIDPANGDVTRFTLPAGMLPDSQQYGAAWTYGNGNMAFSNNNTGRIFQIHVDDPASANPTFTLVNIVNGPSATNNDGTSILGDPTDLGVVKTGPAVIGANQTVTWNVTVTNNGPGASSGYVLTDPVPAGVTGVTAAGATPADGSCTVTGNDISCNGDPLGVGAEGHFVFTGVAPATSTVINNTATVFGNEADLNPANNQSTWVTAMPHLAVDKTSSAGADTAIGQVVTYTVHVRNDGTGDYTGGLPASVTDDLANVLDDATWDNDAAVAFGGSGSTISGPSLTGTQLGWTGTLAPAATATLTYSVTVTGNGDHTLVNNACVPEIGQAAQCDGTTTQSPGILVSKTASVAAVGALGTTVTYTVTATNTGSAPFTDAAPAYVYDDLSQVLDEARYNGDATASSGNAPTYSPPTLAWSGRLDPQAQVVITYSVTYTGSGDGHLVNVAYGTGKPNPGPPACTSTDNAGHDLATGIACARVDTPAAKLARVKTASPASGTPVVAGQVLTYTIQYTNTGAADATVNDTDTLTDVLDDATITQAPASNNPALTAGAVTGTGFPITGTVPAGQTIAVTYQATVKSDADRLADGNNDLVNWVGTPGATCAQGNPNCSDNKVPLITATKTASPASGSVVQAGQVVTYTVTFHNAGSAPGAVARDDLLTGVLDDAAFTSGPTVGGTGLSASRNGDRIVIAGTLQPGESGSVTYAVTVNPTTQRGDNDLHNVVVPAGQTACTLPDPACPTPTDHTMPQLSDHKTVDPASGSTVVAGQVLTYTLTFINSGTAPGAVARDDVLTDVLDDADLTGAPTVSDPALTATVSGDRMSITGTLRAPQTVTVTYKVTVKPDGQRGNDHLVNALTPPGGIVTCVAGSPDCPENFIPDISDSKKVDPASGTNVVAGQVLTYTLTFVNNGTGAGAVNRVDDASGVLDDADLTTPPTSSDPLVTPTVNGDKVAITGTLAAHATATVTYQVTVKKAADRGDSRIINELLDPGTRPSPTCVTGDPDCVENDIPHLTITKASDATPTEKIGDVITYQVTVTNDGSGPFTAASPATATDDLTNVLDDATYNADADAPLGTLDYTEPKLTWTGPLAAHASVMITYSVTATGAGDQAVTNDACVSNADENDTCATTTTGLADIGITKKADPASGATVHPGDTVTYTLTVTNKGTGAGLFSYTDSLAKVLDDADMAAAPTADTPDVTVGALTGQAFMISGQLAAKEVATVTYSVTVRPWASQGDHSLGNWVTVTGVDPPATCAAGDTTCTVNPVAMLALTGMDSPLGAFLAAFALLAAGLVLWFLRRRRGMHRTSTA